MVSRGWKVEVGKVEKVVIASPKFRWCSSCFANPIKTFHLLLTKLQKSKIFTSPSLDQVLVKPQKTKIFTSGEGNLTLLNSSRSTRCYILIKEKTFFLSFQTFWSHQEVFCEPHNSVSPQYPDHPSFNSASFPKFFL